MELNQLVQENRDLQMKLQQEEVKIDNQDRKFRPQVIEIQRLNLDLEKLRPVGSTSKNPSEY